MDVLKGFINCELRTAEDNMAELEDAATLGKHLPQCSSSGKSATVQTALVRRADTEAAAAAAAAGTGTAGVTAAESTSSGSLEAKPASQLEDKRGSGTQKSNGKKRSISQAEIRQGWMKHIVADDH